MSTEDDTPATPGPRTTSLMAGAVAEAREEMELLTVAKENGEMLRELLDDRALKVMREDRKARRIEGCMEIMKQIFHKDSMKYYAGIVVLVMATQAGLSFSGYGLTVSGSADCPPVAAPAKTEAAAP